MKIIKISDLLKDNTKLISFYQDMQNGAVCAIPTDTLYGFAADSNNKKAVEKIYKIKSRNAKKPLILFVDNIKILKELDIIIPDIFYKKLLNLWPGALTVIFDRINNCNKRLKAFNHNTLGIRMPAHHQLLQLLNGYRGLFLTTSANKSGTSPLISAQQIELEFKNEIDWLIKDDNENSINNDNVPPSTVIKVEENKIKILRQGKINITLDKKRQL